MSQLTEDTASIIGSAASPRRTISLRLHRDWMEKHLQIVAWRKDSGTIER
jgi:hypothetical protein